MYVLEPSRGVLIWQMGTEKDLRLGDDERRPVHKMGVRWVEVGSIQHQRSSLCGRLESR